MPHGSAIAVAPKFLGYPDGVLSFRRPTRRTWEAAPIDLFQLFEIGPKRPWCWRGQSFLNGEYVLSKRQGAFATSLVNCGRLKFPSAVGATRCATAWRLQLADPSFSEKIESLATTLASGRGGQIVQELARQVAEAHLDLVRNVLPIAHNAHPVVLI